VQEIVRIFLLPGAETDIDKDLITRCAELDDLGLDSWQKGLGDLGRIKNEVIDPLSQGKPFSIPDHNVEIRTALRTYEILTTLEAGKLICSALDRDYHPGELADVQRSWSDALKSCAKIFARREPNGIRKGIALEPLF
jgi:hypothetical protein